jgi:hypothetical protein
MPVLHSTGVLSPPEDLGRLNARPRPRDFWAAVAIRDFLPAAVSIGSASVVLESEIVLGTDVRVGAKVGLIIRQARVFPIPTPAADRQDFAGLAPRYQRRIGAPQTETGCCRRGGQRRVRQYSFIVSQPRSTKSLCREACVATN